MAVLWRQCTICSDERPFEQPPCADEHDPSCPEWVCLDCGAALLIEVTTPQPAASVA